MVLSDPLALPSHTPVIWYNRNYSEAYVAAEIMALHMLLDM